MLLSKAFWSTDFFCHALQECDFITNFCKQLKLFSMFVTKKNRSFFEFFLIFTVHPAHFELGSRRTLSYCCLDFSLYGLSKLNLQLLFDSPLTSAGSLYQILFHNYI
ncbi:hypothetical protein ACQJBY_033481 [Aegilops geniculata]